MGNLSLRGESQMLRLGGDNCFFAALNLEHGVISTSSVQDGVTAVPQSKKKGTRVHFPSDLTLCSRVISSKNFLSALSVDKVSCLEYSGCLSPPNLKRLRKFVRLHSVTLVAIYDSMTSLLNL